MTTATATTAAVIQDQSMMIAAGDGEQKELATLTSDALAQHNQRTGSARREEDSDADSVTTIDDEEFEELLAALREHLSQSKQAITQATEAVVESERRYEQAQSCLNEGNEDICARDDLDQTGSDDTSKGKGEDTRAPSIWSELKQRGVPEHLLQLGVSPELILSAVNKFEVQEADIEGPGNSSAQGRKARAVMSPKRKMSTDNSNPSFIAALKQRKEAMRVRELQRLSAREEKKKKGKRARKRDLKSGRNASAMQQTMTKTTRAALASRVSLEEAEDILGAREDAQQMARDAYAEALKQKVDRQRRQFAKAEEKRQRKEAEQTQHYINELRRRKAEKAQQDRGGIDSANNRPSAPVDDFSFLDRVPLSSYYAKIMEEEAARGQAERERLERMKQARHYKPQASTRARRQARPQGAEQAPSPRAAVSNTQPSALSAKPSVPVVQIADDAEGRSQGNAHGEKEVESKARESKELAEEAHKGVEESEEGEDDGEDVGSWALTGLDGAALSRAEEKHAKAATARRAVQCNGDEDDAFLDVEHWKNRPDMKVMKAVFGENGVSSAKSKRGGPGGTSTALLTAMSSLQSIPDKAAPTVALEQKMALTGKMKKKLDVIAKEAQELEAL